MPARIAGKVMIAWAKISGIMPTLLTRSGIWVVPPPYCLRPRTRLPYCTGMRRVPCSMTTMKTTVAKVRATNANRLKTAHSSESRNAQAARNLRDDTRENDQRKAVADTLLGDQIAEPDREHRPGGHRRHDRYSEQEITAKSGQNLPRVDRLDRI